MIHMSSGSLGEYSAELVNALYFSPSRLSPSDPPFFLNLVVAETCRVLPSRDPQFLLFYSPWEGRKQTPQDADVDKTAWLVPPPASERSPSRGGSQILGGRRAPMALTLWMLASHTVLNSR